MTDCENKIWSLSSISLTYSTAGERRHKIKFEDVRNIDYSKHQETGLVYFDMKTIDEEPPIGIKFSSGAVEYLREYYKKWLDSLPTLEELQADGIDTGGLDCVEFIRQKRGG